MDIREKIKKLLSLAGNNPSEEEAKAALLKARKLMAKHKLQEEDFREDEHEVVQLWTDCNFTARRDTWISELARIMAERYCCISCLTHKTRGKTYRVGFIGFREDAEAVMACFQYAADFVLAECKRLRKELGGSGNGTAEIREAAQWYGRGFCEGLENAYRRQDSQDKETALAIVVPDEVKKVATDVLGPPPSLRVDLSNLDQLTALACFRRGRREGEHYLDGTQLPGSTQVATGN